ncbi:MAG: PLP-dependent aminotransferase family protein [Rubrivivax sp.]|nr:PLP-dependent aminotransferase family protein [Pyrinomonadaceae bacterium]
MDFPLTLDDANGQPLYRQLCEELRRSILTGRLQPGQRVPSTRALARTLGISRATTALSYEELISEGYLEAARGSGTFVCRLLPDALLRAAPVEAGKGYASKAAPRLSAFGAGLTAAVQPKPPGAKGVISFARHRPDYTRLPLRQWNRLLARHARSAPRAVFDDVYNPLGHRPLRESIARYLTRARAARCDPEQVIICAGSQQAIDLTSRVLVDRGDTVALEDPCYVGARQIFQAQGAKLLPVPVDDSGMVVAWLDCRAGSEAKLVYVTPSHQYPKGTLLSLPRRLELLAWAARNDAFIIEDDYDSEYRYCGRPVPALQGLDRGGRVIYAGTFSKVLFPALRIGYLIAPPSLVEVLGRAKMLADRQSPMLEQYVLADFIEEGHLERHVRRMRTLYGNRRRALVSALTKYFDGRVEVTGQSAGMHLLARLRTGLDDEEVVARARAANVEVMSAREFYLRAAPSDEFIFSFPTLSERQIAEGIRRLAKALA